MEMDMDIPLPEELEWLEESNALMPEEEEEEDQFVDEDDELLQLCKAIPEEDDVPVPKIHKRQRLEEDEDGLLEDRGVCKSAQKRRTKGEAFGGIGEKDSPVMENDEEDEDWLRYSPTKNEEVEAGGNAGVVFTESVVVEEKILSRFASEIDGDCIPVTGPCGNRVYAKLSSGTVDAGIRHQMVDRPAKGLLLEPINALVERVEEEALKKVLQESFGSPSGPTTPMDSTVSEQLWVEKYAPKCFLELLSDEQTNREVLLWLKQWDSCVFGSLVRATSDDVLSALRRHLSVAQSQHNNSYGSMDFSKKKGFPFNNRNFNRSNNLDKENKSMQESSDPSSTKCLTSTPPEQKVLLLCGPPGLGKTTLAHVAAKHCGYRVVEINASDERSSSMIESKILDVVQMNSVMSDSKPKCLVIDEIDGALGEGKGAVEAILKMVLAEKNCSHENNNPVGPPKKFSRKARKTAKLIRPVICICNDLYAPVLRPLRQVAKVHIFVQPTISRVVNRLRYICKLENFKTSSIALSTLAEYTECDIRSCLNTLQFLHKKNETLDSLEIDRQVIGRKDMSRTAFDVWKEIFQKRKAKHDKKTKFLDGVSGDFESMYSLISNRGEHELTMDGVYENFLQLSYHDPMMHKTVSCLDALGISDSLLRYMMRTQQMFLFAYQPFVAISVKNLIAQVGRPHIEWPKSIQRCRMMIMEKKELFKLWNNKLPPSISRHLPLESFVEDVITPLLHILSPPSLRPVALHLLSEREKDELSQLVDTMVSYSITYKSSKPEHTPMTDKYGASSEIQSLSLEPPIDNFISFKDHQPGHGVPPLAIKQLLVHEVGKQRILRETAGKSSIQNSGSSRRKNQSPPSGHTQTFPENADIMIASSGKASPQPTNSASNVNRSSPSAGQKLQVPGGPKKSSKRFSGFFGRFTKDSKDSRNSKNVLSATIKRDSRPFMFKYNEGFTNAVKRPVRIRELLL